MQAPSTQITSFDFRLGRPTTKLGFQFSQITKKWTVQEPYQEAIDKPDS